MRIGIDARLIEETGVGRYIRNLIAELGVIDTRNEYVVFLRKKSFDMVLPSRWEKRLADLHWHTISEQLVMPKLFVDANLDLVHIPYHNPPIFYYGRMVVTIHDLTILHFNTGKATTLPMPIYKLKRFGYWSELMVGLRRAKSIIAVSESTKREIIDHFRVDPSKVVVTYEAADVVKARGKRLVEGEYILYVGNAYPHKNLETLLKAMTKVKAKLVLVGNDDFFYRRLMETADKRRVIFFGPANDSQLANLYTYARALVFPSLMEGFGLPALEALSYGTPVAVSDIPVFHEILGDYATYFDASSPERIAEALRSIHKRPVSKSFFDRYSWRKMAVKTLEIYRKSVVQ